MPMNGNNPFFLNHTLEIKTDLIPHLHYSHIKVRSRVCVNRGMTSILIFIIALIKQDDENVAAATLCGAASCRSWNMHEGGNKDQHPRSIAAAVKNAFEYLLSNEDKEAKLPSRRWKTYFTDAVTSKEESALLLLTRRHQN